MTILTKFGQKCNKFYNKSNTKGKTYVKQTQIFTQKFKSRPTFKKMACHFKGLIKYNVS